MTEYEDGHRIAVARELTYAAGFPLRDRYGFASSDEDVLFVVEAVFREPDDKRCGDLIGLANGEHTIEIAEHGVMASEEYEQGIIAALRPLADQRRAAAERSLS